MPNTEVSQAALNGKKFLQERRTLILGISPGNPYYYQLGALERLFDFSRRNSDKVLLFIPDKISEHNYRAVRSRNPEKSARIKGNRLRNKCSEAIKSSGLCDSNYRYIRWMEDVETCPKYTEAYQNIQELYEANEQFRTEIRQSTEAALRCLKNGREKPEESCNKENREAGESMVDFEEGEKYLLKELAFFEAVPSVYESCQEFVFVYHRPWPVLEKFFAGFYDGIVRHSLGFVVFD